MKNLLGKVKKAMFSQGEGVNTLVVSAILVVIAVALCLIFKDYISELLTNVFTKVNAKVDDQLG